MSEIHRLRGLPSVEKAIEEGTPCWVFSGQSGVVTILTPYQSESPESFAERARIKFLERKPGYWTIGYPEFSSPNGGCVDLDQCKIEYIHNTNTGYVGKRDGAVESKGIMVIVRQLEPEVFQNLLDSTVATKIAAKCGALTVSYQENAISWDTKTGFMQNLSAVADIGVPIDYYGVFHSIVTKNPDLMSDNERILFVVESGKLFVNTCKPTA